MNKINPNNSPAQKVAIKLPIITDTAPTINAATIFEESFCCSLDIGDQFIYDWMNLYIRAYPVPKSMIKNW